MITKQKYLKNKKFVLLPNDKIDFFVEIAYNKLGDDKDIFYKRNRKREIVKNKQVVIWALCHFFNVKIIDLAAKLNFDHSTIIYHRNRFEELMFLYAEERKIGKQVESLIIHNFSELIYN